MTVPVPIGKKELSVIFSQELPKYFHKHEIDLVREAIKHKEKDYLLCELLWQAGARISEVLHLRVKDIDFHAKAIRLITLKKKNRVERVIPTQGSLLGLLGAYIASKELKRDDRLFKFTRQRAYQIVRDAVLKAGLDKERAHPHTYRHSFGVFCVLNRVPILVIQQWMGHSNIQNTLIYLKVLGSDTRQFHEALNF